MRSISVVHEPPHWLGNTMSDELQSIYTPLEVARREIWKRWNDRKLRQRIEDFFESRHPEFLCDGPKAVLARNIASPNMELIHFFDLAESSALTPIVMEYLSDEFTPKNQEKYFLGKLFFFGGWGRRGGARLKAARVIDFNAAHGKKLAEIKTHWGETLPDFHHRILSRVLPGAETRAIDMSQWVSDNGARASTFYLHYLSFFICHAVLFENFVLQYEEQIFTRQVVIPTILQLESLLGVKPLIVPLCPFANEDDPYWKYYPEETQEWIRIEDRQSTSANAESLPLRMSPAFPREN